MLRESTKVQCSVNLSTSANESLREGVIECLTYASTAGATATLSAACQCLLSVPWGGPYLISRPLILTAVLIISSAGFAG